MVSISVIWEVMRSVTPVVVKSAVMVLAMSPLVFSLICAVKSAIIFSQSASPESKSLSDCIARSIFPEWFTSWSRSCSGWAFT